MRLAFEHRLVYIKGFVGPTGCLPESIIHPSRSWMSSLCWAVPMVEYRSLVAFKNNYLFWQICERPALLYCKLSSLTDTVPTFSLSRWGFGVTHRFSCILHFFSSWQLSYRVFSFVEPILGSLICSTILYAVLSSSKSVFSFYFPEAFLRQSKHCVCGFKVLS